MPTARECLCCQEVEKVVYRIDPSDSAVTCNTEYGFYPVCLNIWVLQTAYFEYRQSYGTSDLSSISVPE